MYSRKRVKQETTSTPKRRRLGMRRILLSSQTRLIEENQSLSPELSTSRNGILNDPLTSPIRCDSPTDTQLPCNQIEFLSKSSKNWCSEGLPCSLDLNSPVVNTDSWKSLEVSSSNLFDEQNINKSISKEIFDDIDDITDDMFCSRLEHNEQINQSSILRPKDQFKEDISHTFENINKSISNNKANILNTSVLIETKDSFLLDIPESDLVTEKKDTKDLKNLNIVENRNNCSNTFYGLPLIVKGLFKSYRNIEKFYGWQEDCLNLNAIKERRNLIYSLPTSGGKTLVAEVLMLRELLLRKRNALFILPFVAIVQEKIWSLSPFAVQLEFLVEEYAGGKGLIPPKKRRKKNSIYIATIEKGLALIRSLIELDRLQEIGLIVVDELHLIGEPGRGATLETLLSTVIFANHDIQIIGMSATIGNLDEIAEFLNADVFQREFRPVELTEYVKLGDKLHKIVRKDGNMELVPHRELAYDYSEAARKLDPDWLGGLVSELGPTGSCLVFCPTKRNCENVAALLCKLQRREMMTHRSEEREALASALRSEGAAGGLLRAVRCGVAFHHAGLGPDERALLEQAFRSGVVSVICCTSTLAAGVNLPAQRVIIRAPLVGRAPLSPPAYRQMAGRAGRAGHCPHGESILMCGAGAGEWEAARAAAGGSLPAVRSVLAGAGGAGVAGGAGGAVCGALAAALSLRAARSRRRLLALLRTTLLAHQLRNTHRDNIAVELELKRIRDDALQSLIEDDVVVVVDTGQPEPDEVPLEICKEAKSITLYEDSKLDITDLGRAAMKGCVEVGLAKQMVAELQAAAGGLVVRGPLHLLYLASPPAAPPAPDRALYYTLYSELDEEGALTARALGLSERVAVRLITGKPITNVPEMVLNRFYYAMMLRDLWNQMPVHVVAEKYVVSRGACGSALQAAGARAAALALVCEACPALWALAPLLAALGERLRCAAAPHLAHLMQLPAVKKGRALQLVRAGFGRVEQLARASPDALSARLPHLPRAAAQHLISAARMMLIEKVENLRAEAEDVMEELNN